MKESVIASSHHFYVVFFDSARIKTLGDVTELFSDKQNSEDILIKNKKYLHVQLLIAKQYGSERVLIANQVIKKDTIYYWYDLYIGKTELEGKNVFFICYPYYKLRNYLQDAFREKGITPLYYKAQVKKVLEYMKTGDHKASNNTIEGFNADIIKYSAAIKDEANANKINLIGANPLNSRVFDILNDDKLITISTTSLKLKCAKANIGELEISFDRLGNYRFWIRRDAAAIAIPMIPHAFQFFGNIDALLADEHISTQTLLEDE